MGEADLMKKIFILSIGLLLVINLVSALECQYTQTENYTQFVNYSRIGSVDYGKPFIEIKNFAQSSSTGDRYITYSTSPTKFDVFNNFEYPVKIDLSYIVDGQPQEKTIEIAPAYYQTISYDYPKNIVQDTIRFKIIDPSYLKQGIEQRTFTRDVCKQCEGKDCLNDGASCSRDAVCGSGICNIARFCGDKIIVPCANGTLNCNNQSCLKPSMKKSGEAYQCIWECKSGVGYKGVCKDTFLWNLMKVMLFLVFLALILSLAWFFYRRGEKYQEEKIKKLEKLEEDIKKKEEIKKELKKEVKNKEEIKKIVEEIKEETKKLQEEKEKYKKERLTPFLNAQGSKVIINENGYEVFQNSGKLFHRWWYETQHHAKIKPGCEIHHKNFNKRDNDIKNLQEVTVEEHDRLHAKRDYEIQEKIN